MYYSKDILITSKMVRNGSNTINSVPNYSGFIGSNTGFESSFSKPSDWGFAYNGIDVSNYFTIPYVEHTANAVTQNIPSDVNGIKVIVIGAGGGGGAGGGAGGANPAKPGQGGLGGGGGGLCLKTYNSLTGNTYNISIGIGGNGGKIFNQGGTGDSGRAQGSGDGWPGDNGNAGTFTTFTLTGSTQLRSNGGNRGSGGGGGKAALVNTVGTGGNSVTGDINSTGNSGKTGTLGTPSVYPWSWNGGVAGNLSIPTDTPSISTYGAGGEGGDGGKANSTTAYDNPNPNGSGINGNNGYVRVYFIY